MIKTKTNPADSDGIFGGAASRQAGAVGRGEFGVNAPGRLFIEQPAVPQLGAFFAITDGYANVVAERFVGGASQDVDDAIDGIRAPN